MRSFKLIGIRVETVILNLMAFREECTVDNSVFFLLRNFQKFSGTYVFSANNKDVFPEQQQQKPVPA